MSALVTISEVAGALALAFGAVGLAGYVVRARRNARRIDGHGVTLPRRKHFRYKPPRAADLSRDDVDPYWGRWREQVIDVSNPRWESTWQAFAELDADLEPEKQQREEMP